MSILEEEKAATQAVDAIDKTPEQRSTAESLKAQDDASKPRPHVSFKTKMAILVLFPILF